MGMDIGIYIQRRTQDGWKNVSLYQSDNKKVVIWYRGYDIADYFRDCGSMHVDVKDLRELALQEDWIERASDILPCWHAITYSKIKYLANLQGLYNKEDTIEESVDQANFWRNLKDKISMYLEFTDCEYIDSDNIRIIAFESC